MIVTGTQLLADDVDLVNPIAQVIAAAFGAAGASGGIDWGVVLGLAAILALTLALIAQAAVYIAETGRLPMVAAWDHLVPAWFTRLHPRYRTPTRSLVVIALAAVLFAFLASSDAGAGEGINDCDRDLRARLRRKPRHNIAWQLSPPATPANLSHVSSPLRGRA